MRMSRSITKFQRTAGVSRQRRRGGFAPCFRRRDFRVYFRRNDGGLSSQYERDSSSAPGRASYQYRRFGITCYTNFLWYASF